MPCDNEGPFEHLNRRHLFKLLASGGVVASVGTATLTSCAKPAESTQTEVAISDLPLDQRIRVLHRELPVEVVRTADGISARSLWCTHMGCEVHWSQEQQVYLCPCHEGVYNKAGRPIKGPPPRPLATVPIEVGENRVLIGSPD